MCACGYLIVFVHLGNPFTAANYCLVHSYAHILSQKRTCASTCKINAVILCFCLSGDIQNESMILMTHVMSHVSVMVQDMEATRKNYDGQLAGYSGIQIDPETNVFEKITSK